MRTEPRSRYPPPSPVAHSVLRPLPRELKYGIPVTDENGNRLGESPNAAKQAIAQVVVSRIGMAVPAMGERATHANVVQLSFYSFRHNKRWMVPQQH